MGRRRKRRTQLGELPSFGLGNSSDGIAVVQDFNPPADTHRKRDKRSTWLAATQLRM
jgi:hypothetical protein